MPWFNKKHTNKKGLEAEIDSILSEMAGLHKSDEDYAKMADNLEKVCKAKSYEQRLKPDGNAVVNAICPVIGSLGAIVLILNYEKLDVVATKALQFVKKV